MSKYQPDFNHNIENVSCSLSSKSIDGKRSYKFDLGIDTNKLKNIDTKRNFFKAYHKLVEKHFPEHNASLRPGYVGREISLQILFDEGPTPFYRLNDFLRDLSEILSDFRPFCSLEEVLEKLEKKHLVYYRQTDTALNEEVEMGLPTKKNRLKNGEYDIPSTDEWLFHHLGDYWEMTDKRANQDSPEEFKYWYNQIQNRSREVDIILEGNLNKIKSNLFK